jgi:hypothetical protein
MYMYMADFEGPNVLACWSPWWCLDIKSFLVSSVLWTKIVPGGIIYIHAIKCVLRTCERNCTWGWQYLAFLFHRILVAHDYILKKSCNPWSCRKTVCLSFWNYGSKVRVTGLLPRSLPSSKMGFWSCFEIRSALGKCCRLWEAVSSVCLVALVPGQDKWIHCHDDHVLVNAVMTWLML